MSCPFPFSALAGLICLAWVRRKLPKMIYHAPMLNMNCQRWLENPRESNMQRDMQWDVTRCTVTSHCISRYTLLSFWKTGGHALQRQEHGTAPAPDIAERGSVHSSCSFNSTNVSGKAETHGTTLRVGSLTQHCDAFSTREEHHDQSTDTQSGGRPPAHPEKRYAHHHRLSAASSELDCLDGSSHLSLQHRGHSPPGEGLCIAHRAFHRQPQDRH